MSEFSPNDKVQVQLQDKNWYNARILEVMDDGKISVKWEKNGHKFLSEPKKVRLLRENEDFHGLITAVANVKPTSCLCCCCPTTGSCAGASKCCWPRTGGVVGKMVWLVGCWRDHQHPSEQPASGEYTPLPLQARGLIVGPHWMGMLGTNFCIVAPCTVFYLLAFLRPTQGYESVHVGLSVGLAVLMLATMLALAFTGCRDPGVIPKQLPEQLEAQRRVREQQRVEAGEHAGDTESLSTCRRCNVMRPPRAQHCIYCDVCVLELDHHCPWMGMCVGKNNIKSFHAFNILWPITMGYFCISFLVYMMLSIVSTRLVPGASLAILNSSTNATG